MDTDSWLDQIKEKAIEPDLPICDPHHHLWDHPNHRYLTEELLKDTNQGHTITHTVFVECMSMYKNDGPDEMKPVGETEFVENLAAQNSHQQTHIAAGIVGFADLSLGTKVESVLEAHLSASPQRFRGIRHASSWDADPNIRNSHTNPPQGLLSDSSFREGFACLQKFGLSFDAWLYHPQLDELTSLAQAFPETPIILDHVSGVLGIHSYENKREEILQEWKSSIRKLAACPNVTVKLGGLGMKIIGFRWHKRDKPPTSVEIAEMHGPYYLHCIEQFGVDRCMFESNFPVDKVSSSYSVLWNSFKRMVEGFSPEEKAALFRDNAMRFYRLT